ncbi:hypothetical protein V8G54_022747 [Vigna mungo]|uniref:Retrovirus-related Pol polyprotein from transposon TNT 1-94-like beta-barrel domain-containing protein n=1 Tax=Vigna mungo TaxID=3915 RepID=A0AAQ3N3X9_VIGMU
MPLQQQYTSRSTGQGPRPYLGNFQWCKSIGHLLLQCPIFRELHPTIQVPQNPPRQQNHYTMLRAHTMTIGPSNHHYLLDSGATHHVTTDLNNFIVYHPYTGPDSLFVGDGSGLHISHSGTLKLHDITLPNVLCVPSMKQNVLSVSKLTKETNYALIFLPDSFVMKDLQTGHTKVKGPCVNDVYIWPSSSPSVNHL